MVKLTTTNQSEPGHEVTFQRERAQDLWAEIEPLLVEHYNEIATFKDIPLAPDKAQYNAADDAGKLRLYTARKAGELVGYAAFLVTQNPHYTTSKQALQDVIFVSAEHRRGRLGLQLLLYAEQELTADNVDVVYHHVKIKHPALGKLLEHLGYEATETMYSKRLKGTG